MGYWIDPENHPGELQDQYDSLCDRLVPPAGSAATAQGEALRSAIRLASEFYRNGNVNWMGQHRDLYLGFVDYIDRTVSMYGPQSLADAAKPFIESVRAIGLYQADENDFGFDPWDSLIHVVVEWCLAHPEPLPVGNPASV